MRDMVIFDTNRAGYSPKQCGHTMTVRELIQLLEELDDGCPVYFRNDNGYTYGSLTGNDISILEEQED